MIPLGACLVPVTRLTINGAMETAAGTPLLIALSALLLTATAMFLAQLLSLAALAALATHLMTAVMLLDATGILQIHIGLCVFLMALLFLEGVM